ncbi:condensation domain-containing protein [Sinosporangium siamense]|uniref:Condensation domain-containing protein n=1 Tax=Sinosporangium siamense TaxID=1367973 RepID=A0A919V985_9ACTN|nr:condensation domain-containing protein [Sinosporangium siamense]GII89884.1 hypothetical protein Ssi02_01150 [Sinosporangium siamense]
MNPQAIRVAFEGGGEGRGPLTWGQRAIWETVEATAPDDHYFNFGHVLAVPRAAWPLTPQSAAAAVSGLVERHPALRTTTPEGRGQVVHGRGELTAEIVTAEPGEGTKTATELLERLKRRRFDYAAEWPLRAGLVTSPSGVVTHLVLVYCHMAVDGLGAEIVLRDLRLLLIKGRVAGTLPATPLELALWQESEQGRRVAQAAEDYWEGEFLRVPASMFPAPAAEVEGPPIWRAVLTSHAAEAAARHAAARYSTSAGAVLLVGACAMTSALTGLSRCAMLPIVGNRFRADTRAAVTTLSQESLFTLDVTDGGRLTMAGLLTTAKPALLRAYRYGFHDPAGRAAATARASEARGEQVRPYCCFNDMRFADPPAELSDAAEVRDALTRSTLAWPLSQEQLNCRFCVHVSGEGGALALSLTADTRYVPKEAMERWLSGLEMFLMEAAFGDGSAVSALRRAG